MVYIFLLSMLLYLSLFILFIALYYIAERKESKILFLISLIPPVLFEGLRDELIGRDMAGYGTLWFYNMDIKDNLASIIENALTPEYGYFLVIYISKLITPDIHLYMTICALIKLLMVYLTAYKLRNVFCSVIFLFAYYCFFYVNAFSMMRQGVAVAICIYSLTYYFNHKLIKFLILVVIAYFFHNSAILMCLFLPLYYMRNMKLKYIIITTGIVLTYTFIELFFSVAFELSLFKSNMADLYIDSGVTSAKTNILLSILFLLYSLLLKLWSNTEKDKLFYFFVSSFFSLLFLLLASYVEVAYRMSYYMFIMSMLLSVYFMRQRAKLRGALYILYLCFFFLHFYIECSHGLGEALDYSSKILGI